MPALSTPILPLIRCLPCALTTTILSVCLSISQPVWAEPNIVVNNLPISPATNTAPNINNGANTGLPNTQNIVTNDPQIAPRPASPFITPSPATTSANPAANPAGAMPANNQATGLNQGQNQSQGNAPITNTPSTPQAVTASGAPTLASDMQPTESALNTANQELLSRNAQLQRQVNSLQTQTNVLANERSGELFLYGAFTAVVALIIGIILGWLMFGRRNLW